MFDIVAGRIATYERKLSSTVFEHFPTTLLFPLVDFGYAPAIVLACLLTRATEFLRLAPFVFFCQGSLCTL